MSRLQLALNVSDLDASVAFYSRLFGTEPAKRRPGYANFAIAEPPLKLVLFENGDGGTLNHLGVETESTDEVLALHERATAVGITSTDPGQENCCFAVQDKFWTAAPDGERWEVYTVLEDSEQLAPTTVSRDVGCC